MQISRMTFSLQTFPAFIPDAVLQERSVRFRTNRKHLTHLPLWLLSFHPVVSTYPRRLGMHREVRQVCNLRGGSEEILDFFSEHQADGTRIVFARGERVTNCTDQAASSVVACAAAMQWSLIAAKAKIAKTTTAGAPGSHFKTRRNPGLTHSQPQDDRSKKPGHNDLLKLLEIQAARESR